MSSYFDYFCKNIEKRAVLQDSQEGEQIKGSCYSMCPPDEVKLRETSKLVHVLEVLGNEKKLVKSYCRSAADSYIAVPKLLRPYSVLMKTVQYLLHNVTKRSDVPQSIVYDFVNDRLRAVRQDMTIQRMPPEDCIQLLEPMVRFYVYYGYLLADLPLKDYDPVLNKKYLLECTKWYLSCCDNIVLKPDVDIITAKLKHMNRNELSCDRVLIECLYILCNLDNVYPLYRFVNLPKEIKSEPKLQVAYEIGIANLQGNFIKVCKLLENLCPLTYCALFSYLPTLQRRALQVLSHAYHSKRLTVPSIVITQWLKFSDQTEAETTCAHYGLKVEGGAVRFDKTEFNVNAHLHQLSMQDLQTKFKKYNIVDIYTYATNE